MQGNKVVDLSSYFLLSAAQKGTALVNFTLPYVQWKQRKRGNEYGILANIRKHLSTVRVTDHWHSLPRKVVSSTSLEILESCLDMDLGKWLCMALLEQRAGPGKLLRCLRTSGHYVRRFWLRCTYFILV